MKFRARTELSTCVFVMYMIPTNYVFAKIANCCYQVDQVKWWSHDSQSLELLPHPFFSLP